MEAIRKKLAVVGLEMVSTGKLGSSEVGELSEILAHDLRDYPLDLVEEALKKHREKSPFWPSLADLMEHIQPRLEQRRRAKLFNERKQAWTPDQSPSAKKNDNFRSISVAAGFMDEDPQEVRTAAVAEWKNGGVQRLMDSGIEAERLRGGTRTSEKVKLDSKDQPWNDPEALKASALRLNAFDESLGKEPAFSLKQPKPNTEE